MDDDFNLERFVEAQESLVGYQRALEEVRHGRKVSHWIWYVFPQLAGLGTSEMSRFYAISSIAEAHAYLQHPLLGGRLREITTAATTLAGINAADVFGPDDVKFHSSMTLFALAAPHDPVFKRALDRYFAGEADASTIALLATST